MYLIKVTSKNYPHLFANSINQPPACPTYVINKSQQSLGLHYRNVVLHKDVTRGGIKITFQRWNG